MVAFGHTDTDRAPGTRSIARDRGSGPERILRVDGRRLCADGGVEWSDLTGFQRDLLRAIRRCAKEDSVPTGQTIKERLETQYGEEINNGRLYQNLGHLVDRGLLEKGFVDGRTNTYLLEPAAAAMLDETATQLADICEIEVLTGKS